ncbi:hypothetical protein DM02DRAFT_730885 [Periconia macrospinosa]|uniref:Uncharacterized protein n=1 Tax=Periconia macrospinosa TaxID=97972 RepID=A0A2V1DFV5_9PLEO|nr:hypothetical protein DM02DRAFT_730885 [Periconia macrospinosa]
MYLYLHDAMGKRRRLDNFKADNICRSDRRLWRGKLPATALWTDQNSYSNNNSHSAHSSLATSPNWKRIMARKKKNAAQTDTAPATTTASSPSPTSTSTPTPAPSSIAGTASSAGTGIGAGEPSTSALIICRNKHWRYISSFHGPWLQLPPEVLESLAHSNYLSPRPHPIDPAVFYDLVKIRKAVDEATNLAVRATSGLTSQALSNSLNAGNGMLGNAAALGIGYGGGGGNTKLSRERKHRMRELATAKLSQAYHLDEIAASVATMQSASTLEDVAQFVLQRNPNHVDAKYVHFFHEKIPSRMMAQCTPLDTLNQIISENPNDGPPRRTRALTRIFKEDYVNSAQDLTDALRTARYNMAQHRAGNDQLVLAKSMQEQHGRDWRQEVKIPDEDQPNSLETQLLFHRAGVYFTIACQHVHAALDGLREAEEAKAKRDGQIAAGEEPTPETPEEAEGNRRRAEARKQVRQNAKRALRDYTAFLSHFDYTPGISAEVAEEFLRRLGGTSNGAYSSTKDNLKQPLNRLLDSAPSSSTDANSPPISEALVPHRGQRGNHSDRASWPKLPPPEIFKVSQLFDSAPPASLPPYPQPIPKTAAESAASAAAAAFADSHESITYHPLLTDALHSLLLCHALVQTTPKELQRHAHNAARLARVCDGYPIFLAARSPARADWIEVLRRAGNWIGLSTSWETLCRPAPLPGQGKSPSAASSDGASSVNGAGRGPSKPDSPRAETESQKRERQKHEAILEALADERVVDEESFQRAVRARERRFREDEEAESRAASAASASASSSSTTTTATNSSTSTTATTATNGTQHSSPSRTPTPTTPAAAAASSSSSSSSSSTTTAAAAPKRWAQDDGREYPISTERAEAISRWVRDAPPVAEGAGSGGKGGKKRRPRSGKGGGGGGGKVKGGSGEVEKEMDGKGGGKGIEKGVERLRVGE